MVRFDIKTTYICVYCGNEYDNEDEAWDCAQNCMSDIIEQPRERETEIFVCELCGETFCLEDKAESCEKAHKENDDVHWGRRQLEKAANHPKQRKLENPAKPGNGGEG